MSSTGSISANQFLVWDPIFLTGAFNLPRWTRKGKVSDCSVHNARVDIPCFDIKLMLDFKSYGLVTGFFLTCCWRSLRFCCPQQARCIEYHCTSAVSSALGFRIDDTGISVWVKVVICQSKPSALFQRLTFSSVNWPKSIAHTILVTQLWFLEHSKKPQRMGDCIIRGYLIAGTGQRVSAYSLILLPIPVHEERTQEF